MYTFLFITNNNKSIENNNAMSIIKLKRRESMRNRITILKEKMLDEKRYASIEQARIITRIYKENETLSVPMKRALSLKAALEEIEIGVEKEELIVGNRTKGSSP